MRVPTRSGEKAGQNRLATETLTPKGCRLTPTGLASTSQAEMGRKPAKCATAVACFGGGLLSCDLKNEFIRQSPHKLFPACSMSFSKRQETAGLRTFLGPQDRLCPPSKPGGSRPYSTHLNWVAIAIFIDANVLSTVTHIREGHTMLPVRPCRLKRPEA